MFTNRLLSSATLLAVLLFSAHLQGAEPTTRQVHVSGEGLVRVVPDEVVISMEITTVDDDLLRVRADSDQQARAVLGMAKKHGAEEDGFQVSRLELSLDYSEQLQRRIYQVDRDLTIRLRQLDNLDGLLSELLGVQNSQIDGITFGIAQARKKRLEALSRAVADAREKAALLAELNGMSLGKALDIRVIAETESPFVISVVPFVGSAGDQTRGGEPEHGRTVDFRRQTQDSLNGSSPIRLVAFQATKDQPQPNGKDAKKATPFALGLIDITARVEIDFELVK